MILATSFAQILTDIGAVTAAIGALTAALIGLKNAAKIQEVHVLVNSQLTEVMGKLKAVTAERDQLAPDRAGEDPQVEVPPDTNRPTAVLPTHTPLDGPPTGSAPSGGGTVK